MSEQLIKSEVIIIGAGASGLMCAISAAQNNRQVLLLEHNKKVARKVLISGAGHCNFTNLNVDVENFVSSNPFFCKSALSRFNQYDFIALMDKHQIAYHEKKHGQLFCQEKAGDIVNMLLNLCRKLGVKILTECKVISLDKNTDDDKFYLETNKGQLISDSLVMATGGLSIPKIGASDFGLQIARQFDLNIIKPQPALVPLCLEKKQLDLSKSLAGISVDCQVRCNNREFRENLLFTHKGLSGPAILQISNYWSAGQSIEINLLPDIDLTEQINQWRQSRPKTELKTLLGERLSKRLVNLWLASHGLQSSQDSHDVSISNKPVNQYSMAEIQNISLLFQRWKFIPTSSEGYRVAEVTKGGIDCNELSSKTFESKKIANLYFIGELIDVTGWLGGYNLQWAWSSGFCAGQYV